MPRLLVCFVLSSGIVASAKAETLADTLVSAYENSGLLEQNRALLRAADEDVAQIVAQLRPIINWTLDFTQSFGESDRGGFVQDVDFFEFDIGITFSLLLFDFGNTRFQLDAAKETVLATRENLRSIEQQILLRAVTAYLNVQRNQEFLALRDNNVRLLREELRAARDRFEVGEVTRTDVAQAEARLAAAQSGFASAEGDLVQAIEEFRAAVGRTPRNLSSPVPLPRLSGQVAADKAIALRSHPSILQAQRQVASAEFTIKAAEAAMRPTLNLSGGLSLTEELSGPFSARQGQIGLGVSGPIYQGGLLSSTKRQAIAQRDSQRGNLHEVSRQVEQDVGNAYATLDTARAVQRSSREQVRAAQVAFEGVREEATLGARTTLDVLDAEQELQDAKANLISADVDVFIAAYQVLSSIGQLTARDLNLNVQLYDPAAYYNLVKDAPVPISPQGQKLDRVLKSLGKQ
ncbi:MAG: TolC family outer membrane protein [Pseudomonadota bacterium]